MDSVISTSGKVNSKEFDAEILVMGRITDVIGNFCGPLFRSAEQTSKFTLRKAVLDFPCH
jgi:hypothetical protein